MSRIRFETGLTGLVSLLFALSATTAAGQIASVQAPERIVEGRSVNVFAEWEGKETFEGVMVAVPSGWQVSAGVVTGRDGRTTGLTARPVPGSPARTMWIPSQPIVGRAQIRITLRSGPENGNARWAIVPLSRVTDRGKTSLVPNDARRAGRPMPVDADVSFATRNNRMLRLDGSTAGLELRGDRIPDLGTGSAYTLETWMRTTEAPGVVLSSWDGTESSDYAVELEIDVFGRPAFYQGIGGRHRALRAANPVADGAWHHLAVTHDPARGWTRLLVDGVAVDSLYGFEPAEVDRPERVVVGRRPGNASSGTAFRGDLDELRFWAVSRDPATIRAGMRLILPQPPLGARFLSFDDATPADLLVGGGRAQDRPLSDLVFQQPVRELQVRFDGGAVRLSWSGSDPSVVRYVVESSPDGRVWEDVGGIARTLGRPSGVGEERSFEFVDLPRKTQVAYYRLRQELAQGASRRSAAVKVGLGAIPADWHAELDGNYPNPFNPTTTIRYRVDEPMDLTVSVWDLSGQQVQLLASGSHTPGDYSVTFTADDLPSGTYFVRLESAEGVQSHRMVLAR